jgi:hypothetical protein
MATTPDPREIDWLAQVMAARMLVDAASAARQDQRVHALRAWFPEAQYTEAQMLVLAEQVAEHWRGLSAAVDARLALRQAAGRARPLPGCEGRI